MRKENVEPSLYREDSTFLNNQTQCLGLKYMYAVSRINNNGMNCINQYLIFGTTWP